MSFVNMIRTKEIRGKLIFTLLFLALYRIGFQIPLPGVNYEAFQNAASESGGGLLGVMNIMTGAQLQQATIFSLGVMPYISASIIFSLLTKVVPTLEKLSKEGASGQRKINQYTRLSTIPICLVQSMFVVLGPLKTKVGSLDMLTAAAQQYYGLYVVMVMVSLTAGTMFIMWVGEQITENGVGNGISIIIMAGIVAELWPTMVRLLASGGGEEASQSFQTLLLFLATWAVMVVAVVYMTKAQRRIPIRQAKQTRGRNVYGGQAHFLPFKVNSAGVMPIIFASALLMIPMLLGKVVGWTWLETTFSQGRGFWYVLAYALLIFFFSFFWTSMMFQPADMANNLKEHGSFIPGIRPGNKTAEFLEKTMERITLVGATFLAAVAVFPTFMQSAGTFSGLEGRLVYFMSGTSILIVVGVALDLVEKFNALLVMRNYEGIAPDADEADGKEGGAGGGWGRRGT
jgi:preprotein translocase subunit SecY